MSQLPKVKFRNFGTETGVRQRHIYRWPPEEGVPWVPDPWSTPPTFNLGSRTDSLLLSRGNPAPYGARPQNGGDFFQKTYEFRVKPAYVRHEEFVDAALKIQNEGYLCPSNWTSVGQDPSSWLAVKTAMITMGTKGWNRFAPGKPVASLSQFLGELRQLPKNPVRMAADLVRNMRRAGSKAAGADMLRRSVGDHYLNWSFGWRPFLSDLEKFSNLTENLARALDQLYRDHGKVVRRGGTIESDRQTTTEHHTSDSTAGYFPQMATREGGWSRKTVVITTETRYWFSAGFTYRLPNVNDVDAMRRLNQYLQGGGISPSIVWELTPWSWLADYFTNIGDTLDNWERSRAISLAAKYAYVMYRRDQTCVSTHEMWTPKFNYNGSVISRSITQARTGASAYGFGFTTGSLNNGQIANLVALGMSRRV